MNRCSGKCFTPLFDTAFKTQGENNSHNFVSYIMRNTILNKLINMFRCSNFTLTIEILFYNILTIFNGVLNDTHPKMHLQRGFWEGSIEQKKN
jgi:hypothetical protein